MQAPAYGTTILQIHLFVCHICVLCESRWMTRPIIRCITTCFCCTQKHRQAYFYLEPESNSGPGRYFSFLCHQRCCQRSATVVSWHRALEFVCSSWPSQTTATVSATVVNRRKEMFRYTIERVHQLIGIRRMYRACDTETQRRLYETVCGCL